MRSGKLVSFAVALVVALALSPAAPAFAQSTPPDFIAPLTGTQEVPLRVTDASGVAQFRLIDGGTALAYRLMVDDIENVIASHIHLAPRGVNGSVVAFLYGSVPPAGGPISGIIAEGVITSADLVGPIAGQNLSVLIEAIRTGGAYVNVHTNDGIAPTDTGPGDFPGGEIRGQIRRGVEGRQPVLEGGGGLQ